MRSKQSSFPPIAQESLASLRYAKNDDCSKTLVSSPETRFEPLMTQPPSMLSILVCFAIPHDANRPKIITTRVRVPNSGNAPLVLLETLFSVPEKAKNSGKFVSPGGSLGLFSTRNLVPRQLQFTS